MKANGILVAVLMTIAGGASATDFSDLQTFRVSEVKAADIKGVQTFSLPGDSAKAAGGTTPRAGEAKLTSSYNIFNPGQPPPQHHTHHQDWGNTSCFYDGGNFRVMHRGRLFSQDADDNFKGAVCDGGWDVAALYDGDDFLVFNGRTGRFDYRSVDDGYLAAKIGAGNGYAVMYDGDDFLAYNARTESFDSRSIDDNVDGIVFKTGADMAALYDGDDFIVYNAPAGKFDYRSVDDAVANPIMEIGTDVAALYDGDDLVVYDRQNNQFSYRSVDDNYAGFVLAAGRQVVLAYDGDDVIAYCSPTQSFTTEGADDGAWAQTYAEHNYPGAGPGLLVGKIFYTVDSATCAIRKQEFLKD
jgi:hypothetical protein